MAESVPHFERDTPPDQDVKPAKLLEPGLKTSISATEALTDSDQLIPHYSLSAPP